MRFKKNVRMTLLYLAFIVIGVAMVFPFIWMIATSFKTGTDIYSLSLLPKKFTLENYREVLSGSDYALNLPLLYFLPPAPSQTYR